MHNLNVTNIIKYSLCDVLVKPYASWSLELIKFCLAFLYTIFFSNKITTISILLSPFMKDGIWAYIRQLDCHIYVSYDWSLQNASLSQINSQEVEIIVL